MCEIDKDAIWTQNKKEREREAREGGRGKEREGLREGYRDRNRRIKT